MLSNYQPSKRDYLKRLYYIIVEKGEIFSGIGIRRMILALLGIFLGDHGVI